ncbi:hypothetical protein C2S53_011757 [Perilla frutescens var. hirtella]|uniref:Uncharacterized protein n=1 Tax=Perilla frutescens var. hirtella TaxID=608512 RepID=A0AAD4J8K4_PERFH|nr:hypothetical protein C2S51_003432 [Perilla frutescens var. frutescens]KAH6829187.1 hypothetical protein C2S53_011757 [Perilla frutescens var. hirtella]
MASKPASARPKNAILIRRRQKPTVNKDVGAGINSEESNMARFGPVYEENETDANSKAKQSAWDHIVDKKSDGDEAKLKKVYERSIADIEGEAIGSYDPRMKLKPCESFRWMMVRDGCFFLHIALHILGAWDVLGYPPQHPYFGKKSDSSSWLPAMFWVGNQIPCVVIRALMKQTFFQTVIEKGRWKCPTDDLEKLALYITVVEPELERPKRMGIFQRKPAQFRDGEPPSNILDALHSLVLGSGDNDPIHAEMKEFRDLEAGRGDRKIKIPSAGELNKSGISLRMAKGSGITNIRFQNLGFCAYLYLPPFTINANTERIFTVLASYELNLNESDREVTSYLRFMRDLSHTYKDFKILQRKGIIQVKDDELKGTMVSMLHKIIHSHRSRLTLNFRHTRRKLEDYGGPPWRLISFFLGVLAVVQTIFTILSYFFPHK